MKNNEELNEVLKVKYVVRDNERIKKWVSDRPEMFKVQYDKYGNAKEVRIEPQERLNRKLGQRTARLKRGAKQSVITKKRKKSFSSRKNVGLAKYNKKAPAKVINRDPYNLKKESTKTQNFLTSNFKESFGRYLEKSLLLESPHQYYEKGDFEFLWDWCSEGRDDINVGDWMWQFVDLYKNGYMKSVRKDRNTDYEDLTVFVDEEHRDEIVEDLINNVFHQKIIKNDYINNSSPELKHQMNVYLPKFFFQQLGL